MFSGVWKDLAILNKKYIFTIPRIRRMENIPIFIHLVRDLSGPGSIIDKAVVYLPFIPVLIPVKD
jgi:hypothetical protein